MINAPTAPKNGKELSTHLTPLTLDDIDQVLALIDTLPENERLSALKQGEDIVAGLRTVYRQHRQGLTLQNRAAKACILIQVKGGELLYHTPRGKRGRKPKDADINSLQPVANFEDVCAAADISTRKAYNWQRLYVYRYGDEGDFYRVMQYVMAQGHELTTTAMLRRVETWHWLHTCPTVDDDTLAALTMLDALYPIQHGDILPLLAGLYKHRDDNDLWSTLVATGVIQNGDEASARTPWTLNLATLRALVKEAIVDEAITDKVAGGTASGGIPEGVEHYLFKRTAYEKGLVKQLDAYAQRGRQAGKTLYISAWFDD